MKVFRAARPQLRTLGAAFVALPLIVGAGAQSFAAQSAEEPRQPSTQRVSLKNNGGQTSGGAYSIATTPDARFVAYVSKASDIVPGDTNGAADIFLRDRQTGTTERINVSTTGEQAQKGPVIGGPFGWSFGSTNPTISADGRYVFFSSDAPNLVPGDTNGAQDVFVRDRQAGTTERLSLNNSGAQVAQGGDTPSSSADGRYVAFLSGATNLVSGDTNGVVDAFVRDRQTGTTTRVSLGNTGAQANADLQDLQISADGKVVVFGTTASNLVTGDTNALRDVFARDLAAGTTQRVNVSSTGAQATGGESGVEAGSVSADGRHIAFVSEAKNLVPGDTNALTDFFVRDRQTGVTERVSVDSQGAQMTGNIITVWTSSISADGRYVAFSTEGRLSANDTPYFVSDIFVRDRQTQTTELVSVANDGTSVGSSAIYPALSADGRQVAFVSRSSQLVADDTNNAEDVFVRDRGTL
ncbi:TolB family protein [Streptomyces sp. NPDC050504]|uniref:TolB family protein n=1 Tax=Streptomyces sp. NPDC050504 TaxID=3365618 RepID=UPI0037AA2D8F